MIHLSPCPFCGGQANVYENEVDFIPKWSVGCGDCTANLDVCEDEPEEAAQVWNTRAPGRHCPPGHVLLPESKAEAEMMNIISERYLWPERFATASRSPQGTEVAP